jgi:diguanylate cyclase (GGDEF)-like protein
VAGVVLVDFDGYATVNETTGHAGGDLILAQAGRRLRAAVPPTATVARWGGDEFAVLLSPEAPELGVAATRQEIIELAEHLAGVIAAEPFSVADKEIALTASVGAALAPAGRPGHMVADAQTALAKAQEAGVGRVEIFAPAMHAEAARRMELAADLGRAIAEHALEIEYQPVMDLASSQIRAVEAVVRWSRGPEPVSPAEFLAVAEESGLIVQLGSWLLRRACRQVATWRALGTDIGLSVACTARQAGGPGFVSSVLRALDEAALPPEVLTLELSERMLTDSPPSVTADLAGLRGKGIKVALDCFGTGLVSLASLRNSAVDVVKIDASYVAGLDADPTLAALTRSIIQLGRDLGIEVIADGIERPEQRWRLESMGCALGQGPGIAGPWLPGSSSLLRQSGRDQLHTAIRPLRSAHGQEPRGLPDDRRRQHQPGGDRQRATGRTAAPMAHRHYTADPGSQRYLRTGEIPASTALAELAHDAILLGAVGDHRCQAVSSSGSCADCGWVDQYVPAAGPLFLV